MKTAEEIKNKILSKEKTFTAQIFSQMGETLEAYKEDKNEYSYNFALGSLYAIEEILKNKPNHESAAQLKNVANEIRETLNIT